MKPKLVFRCKICGKECKLIGAHFWRYHYKEKRQELFNSPNMMADMFDKYFEGVTISK